MKHVIYHAGTGTYSQPAQAAQPGSQSGNQATPLCLPHTHRDTDTLCGWECIYPVRSLICFNKRYTFSKYVYAAHEEHDKQPTHAVPELPLGISFSR